MAGKKNTRSLKHRLDVWLIVPLLLVVAIASLIPFFESDAWWIRYLDYPRLQFAILLAVLIVLHLMLGGLRRVTNWIVTVLAGVALASHVYYLYPYVLPVEKPVKSIAACPEDSRLKLLIANVKEANEHAERLFQIVQDTSPDLFLVMETDAWWDRQLDSLNDRLPHRVQYIPRQAESYGMHLLSRHPLLDTQIRFRFDEHTPAINTRVRLPSGESIDFHGLHPRPPLYWSQSTLPRDAQLLATALDIREGDNPAVLAGDFNAVAWESVFRRTLRIGNLLDPRVGRGFYPTYDAHNPLIAWPLDHVIFQNELGLVSFERMAEFGSDHYPVLVELCHRPELAGQQTAPSLAEDDLREAKATIERAEVQTHAVVN
ncbi:endonuclease/exonuclease/phosphatase family protein [Halomonas sp. M20]|uniref:endonuclease/exonuclease/phosphatase family protein n=1 Tax=Halomonas sp. M20 TaxID=2763264 RepID=UPI001D09AA52|nr:endonuclease/exonuclease/phosphatase family protein [Halomonas sp. M20]